MTVKTKAILLFVLGVLTLVAGEYLSGFLMLKLLQETRVPLGVTTYWQYFNARELPQFLPYALKIKLSGAIGFGPCSFPGRRCRYGSSSPEAESTHGEASFATLADLKKAGVLTQTPGKHPHRQVQGTLSRGWVVPSTSSPSARRAQVRPPASRYLRS